MVNDALDKALPQRHPEVLLDSMRCVPFSNGYMTLLVYDSVGAVSVSA